MNHLEQLVAEWLQYNGYFVRVSVPVGARASGGFEGELDVVALHLGRQHLLHVECSLDALSDASRQTRFAAKLERGRKYIADVFQGHDLPQELEQVVVLQFSSGKTRNYGGARLVTVRELVREMISGLSRTSPNSRAVSSNLPLLGTVQLVQHSLGRQVTSHTLLQTPRNPSASGSTII